MAMNADDYVIEYIRKYICGSISFVGGENRFITLPYLNLSNDPVVLEIEITPKGEYMIRDGGSALGYLVSNGFFPSSTDKKALMVNSLIDGSDVSMDQNGEIFSVAPDLESLPEKIFWMAHAVQRVTSALLTSKQYNPPIFKEKVFEFFKEKKIRFKPDPPYTIENVKARLDFESETGEKLFLGRTMSYSRPEKALTYSERYLFEVDLIIKRGVPFGKKYYPLAILDDTAKHDEKPVFNEDIIDLLAKRADVTLWSDRERLVEILG